MNTKFDAIVVGSGFGGSVAALRLAQAGRSVCLLERGKRYPPGSFPRSPHDFSANVWDPSRKLYGMYDIWSFRGIDAVVSSGLGGGSLIYANVMLRKDPQWFVHEDPRDGTYEHWPVTYADLDAHYGTAEAMLGANQYPYAHAPFDRTKKTTALRTAAALTGTDWMLPPLAVDFGGDDPAPGIPITGTNLHGLPRQTCRLCGECDIGCNYGSKNSLDFNYLSEFVREPAAELRDHCEVKRIEPDASGSGYRVYYAHHADEEVSSAHSPTVELTSDVLVLSAGSLGSTFLLLKNRSAFPGLSRALGTRFCGNGDLLGFINARTERSFGPARGPVITSTVRVPDRLDGGDGQRGRGFYIQDGGYPEFLNWVLETANVVSPARRALIFAAGLIRSRLGGRYTNPLSHGISRLLGAGTMSDGLLPVLGMGRDVADGEMFLRDGFLDVTWNIETSMPYFTRVKRLMTELANAMDADLMINPTWWLKRVITVHPLGGSPMGRFPDEGVVDSHGEVFGYPGLFVADGAVMPGPVGANPSLTIAALSERFSERMIERTA